MASLQVYSAYDIPSLEALARLFNSAAEYPVKATWLKVIKAGIYDAWPGLTYSNASKYCPATVPTTKGHMTQLR